MIEVTCSIMFYSDSEEGDDAGPGLSLSDLVYSQSAPAAISDHQRATARHATVPAGSSHSHSRERQMPLPAEAENHRKDKSTYEEEQLDDFYGLAPPMAPIPVTVSSSLPAVRQKLKSRKRKYQLDQDNYESQSAADARQYKREEELKYGRMRLRWQEKKISMEGQSDVGGAVECMARLVMKLKRKRKSKGKPLVVTDQILIYSDSSEDELQFNLGSLLANEKGAERATPVKLEQDDMDYYQQGYTAPRKRDLEFYYGNEHVPLVKKDIGKNDNYPQLAKFPYIPYNRTSGIIGPSQYLISNHAAVRSHFFQKRTTRNLAAKYLVGCAALDPNTDNRLIKMLHRSEVDNHFPVHREQFILYQASEQALDLKFLRSEIWSNKQAVLSQLNIDCNAPSWVGHSLDPSAVRDTRKAKRAKLMDTYGISPIVERYSDAINLTTAAESFKEEVNDLESTSGSENCVTSSSTDYPASGQSSVATVATEQPQLGIQQKKQIDPSQYLYIAGTEPPIPFFPLDEANIVFGKEDPRAQIARACRIERSTYILTTAALLCQLGSARARDDVKKSQEIQDLLISYVERLPALNRKDPTKTKWLKIKGVNEIAMLPYYQSFMHYFSFIANSGAFYESILKSEGVGDGDEYSLGDERSEIIASTPVSLNILAQRIYEAFEAHHTHHGLKVFPRVHLVFALASIARQLPPSAAEIISRPLNNHTTPFDLVNQTLVHMENNKMLTDDRCHVKGSITLHVGQVEYFFHEATSMLQKCVEISQFEPEYACWHLALLAGSLVLSSGNKVGSGAHTLPSSKKVENIEDIFSQGEKVTPKHEIRKMLPKFHETRRMAASAFRSLVEYSRKRPLSKTSQEICSFLEWKDAVSLLAGPPWTRGRDGDQWNQIRRLHAHHFFHWTSTSMPSFTISQAISSIVGRGAAPKSSFLATLAATLENDPGNIQNWRRLVNELGHVGVRVSEEQRTKCENCVECKRLRDGLNVDHSCLREKGWWGEERAWWTDQLLSPVVTITTRERRGALVINVCRVIEANIKRVGENNNDRCLVPDLAYNLNSDDMDWISTSISDEVDSESIAKDQQREMAERTKSYDSEFPVPFNTFGKAQEGSELNSLVPNVMSSSTEVCCYKIFLLCHLSGVHCESVLKLTWQLAKACVFGKGRLEENESWYCLVWLSKRGLCISQILFDFYDQIFAIPISKRGKEPDIVKGTAKIM